MVDGFRARALSHLAAIGYPMRVRSGCRRGFPRRQPRPTVRYCPASAGCFIKVAAAEDDEAGF
ncbi:hypothetical protein ABH945_005505 [Paraburkholderia sp. GAS333]